MDDRGGLENRYHRKVIGGSNPPVSARVFRECAGRLLYPPPSLRRSLGEDELRQFTPKLRRDEVRLQVSETFVDVFLQIAILVSCNMPTC